VKRREIYCGGTADRNPSSTAKVVPDSAFPQVRDHFRLRRGSDVVRPASDSVSAQVRPLIRLLPPEAMAPPWHKREMLLRLV